MLLEFAVENFRSIRDLQVLRLEAEAVQPRYKWLDRNVVEVDQRHRVLKTKVIYGANAAGKSNLIMALSYFQWAVLRSGYDDSSALESVDTFAFDPAYRTSPSHFEVRLLVHNTPYRYGFTVSGEEGITAEWLFGNPGKKEVKYFTRERHTLDLSKTHLKAARKLLAALETKEAPIGSRSLLLSRLGLLKNSEVVEVYNAIRNARIVNRTFEGELSGSTVDVLSDPNQQTRVANFLRQIGIEIGELFVMNTYYDPTIKRPIHLRRLVPDFQGSEPVLYVRPPASAKEQSISFRADTHLSRGTLKMLRLANTLLATLDSGDLLVVDEFESQLHTNISRTILKLFHDPETNPPQRPAHRRHPRH